jgi:hypothetical protein
MKRDIFIVILAVLVTLSIFVLEFTPCKEEEGYFRDELGNGYCFLEEPTFNFFTIDNQVCLLNEEV